MDLTHLLAQLIGIFFLIGGLSVLTRKKVYVHVVKDVEGSQALLYILGMFSLFLGLLMVLTHNLWNSGMLALVVTIVGWVLLLKGIFAMFASHRFVLQVTHAIKIEKFYWVYGIFVILVGLYLTYSGFGL